MIKCHLGPELSVWIMQVSSFSSIHIKRFHCINLRGHNMLQCIYDTALLYME